MVIPHDLLWVGYLAGEEFPEGSEGELFVLGAAWKAAAEQILALVAELEQAASVSASALSGQTADAVAAQFASLLSGDSSVQTMAGAASALGVLATNMGMQVQYTKLQIVSTLGIAAAEIGYALSSVGWTSGASLAWIPPIEAITVAVVRQLVSQLIKRIVAALTEAATIAGVRQVVKDAAVGAAVGAVIGVVQDLAIEGYQIHEGVREGIDWKQVGQISIGAVVGGAAGAVLHGLGSKTMGDPSTIGVKAVKGVLTHFGVGAVGNVAGAGATGGGLNAEDVFGGAGGGAVSGGIHGGSEHPHPAGGTGGGHDGQTAQGPHHDDDDDDASIKTLVGSDSLALPPESGDVLAAHSRGLQGDSASPAAASQNGANGSGPPAQESHTPSAPTPSGDHTSAASSTPAAGRGEQGLGSDAAAASSATSDAPTSQNANVFSGNESGTSGDAQQRAESDPGSGNGQGQRARAAQAGQEDRGAATTPLSTTVANEHALAGNQGSPVRGSPSEVASATRAPTASITASAPEHRSAASPSATDTTGAASGPVRAQGGNPPSGGTSLAAGGWPGNPPAIARTAHSVAAQPPKPSGSRSGTDGLAHHQEEQHHDGLAADADKPLSLSEQDPASPVDGRPRTPVSSIDDKPTATIGSNEAVTSEVGHDVPRAGDLATPDHPVQHADEPAPSAMRVSVERDESNGAGLGPGATEHSESASEVPKAHDRIGDIGHGRQSGGGLGDPGARPSLHEPPTEIRTVHDLTEVVERIAGPKRVVPSADDPRDDPAACTVLLDEAMRALYPDRLAALPATRRTLDDSVLDGKPISRLIGGAEPAPVTSWEEVDQRLHEAAAETGRATALILVQHPNAIGHALGAHRFADQQIAYFDLHRFPGDRVLVEPPRDLSLSQASAVILDGDGHDMTLQAQSSPVVDALTDPIGDPRYGRGGMELEYHGGYLIIPEPRGVAVSSLEEYLPYLATNSRHGLKVVRDSAQFDVMRDGSAAMWGRRSRVGRDVDRTVLNHILELVIERPLPELRGDPATNNTSAFGALTKAMSRLDAMARSVGRGETGASHQLAEIFPADEGWTLHENAADIEFVPVTTGRSAAIHVHHTKGMPLSAVAQFMHDITPHIGHPQQQQFHRDGKVFADTVDEMFADRSGSGRARSAEAPTSAERRDLRGAMWLTYVHAAGLAMATTAEGSSGKFFSTVALRQSLAIVRRELSERAQSFLNDNADAIRAVFEHRFLSRVPDFSSRYLAQYNHGPVAGDTARPLAAVRPAVAVDEAPDTLSVGNYMDTMLLHEPPMTVNQLEAFDVRTYFGDLDREGRGAGEPGLLLLELRTVGARFIAPDHIATQYRQLRGIVRDAVEPAVRTPLNRLARSVAGKFYLAGSRFGEALEDSLGSLLPSGHTPESVAQRYPSLAAVNSERSSADAMTNCVTSAFAFVISVREGWSFEAPHTDRLPGIDLVNFHRQSLGLGDDEHQVSLVTDFGTVAGALSVAGPGAMALMAVRGPGSDPNYVYVAVVDEHGVSFLDPKRGTLAAAPAEGSALAMLPLTGGIPMPEGARLLTAEEIGDHGNHRTVHDDRRLNELADRSATRTVASPVADLLTDAPLVDEVITGVGTHDRPAPIDESSGQSAPTPSGGHTSVASSGHSAGRSGLSPRRRSSLSVVGDWAALAASAVVERGGSTVEQVKAPVSRGPEVAGAGLDRQLGGEVGGADPVSVLARGSRAGVGGLLAGHPTGGGGAGVRGLVPVGVDSRLVEAVGGLGAWVGGPGECVVRVDEVLSRLGVSVVRSVDTDARPVDRVAARLGGGFGRAGSVQGLAGLGAKALTPVWVQPPSGSMHLVLVARGGDDRWVLVETQPGRGASFTEFAVGVKAELPLGRGGGLPRALRGPVRLVVDEQGRLLQLDLSDPGRVVVAVSEQPAHPGDRVVDALLAPAVTASPGMPPRMPPRGPAGSQDLWAAGSRRSGSGPVSPSAWWWAGLGDQDRQQLLGRVNALAGWGEGPVVSNGVIGRVLGEVSFDLPVFDADGAGLAWMAQMVGQRLSVDPPLLEEQDWRDLVGAVASHWGHEVGLVAVTRAYGALSRLQRWHPVPEAARFVATQLAREPVLSQQQVQELIAGVQAGLAEQRVAPAQVELIGQVYQGLPTLEQWGVEPATVIAALDRRAVLEEVNTRLQARGQQPITDGAIRGVYDQLVDHHAATSITDRAGLILHRLGADPPMPEPQDWQDLMGAVASHRGHEVAPVAVTRAYDSLSRLQRWHPAPEAARFVATQLAQQRVLSWPQAQELIAGVQAGLADRRAAPAEVGLIWQVYQGLPTIEQWGVEPATVIAGLDRRAVLESVNTRLRALRQQPTTDSAIRRADAQLADHTDTGITERVTERADLILQRLRFSAPPIMADEDEIVITRVLHDHDQGVYRSAILHAQDRLDNPQRWAAPDDRAPWISAMLNHSPPARLLSPEQRQTLTATVHAAHPDFAQLSENYVGYVRTLIATRHQWADLHDQADQIIRGLTHPDVRAEFNRLYHQHLNPHRDPTPPNPSPPTAPDAEHVRSKVTGDGEIRFTIGRGTVNRHIIVGLGAGARAPVPAATEVRVVVHEPDVPTSTVTISSLDDGTPIDEFALLEGIDRYYRGHGEFTPAAVGDPVAAVLDPQVIGHGGVLDLAWEGHTYHLTIPEWSEFDDGAEVTPRILDTRAPYPLIELTITPPRGQSVTRLIMLDPHQHTATTADRRRTNNNGAFPFTRGHKYRFNLGRREGGSTVFVVFHDLTETSRVTIYRSDGVQLHNVQLQPGQYHYPLTNEVRGRRPRYSRGGPPAPGRGRGQE
ncbi:WXG100-like domain-containing protein [Mycobacterium sp. Dal123C01]|uniref:WXG100-like domain-containing protein n=1 Tax=Mycobacterium sp. Dal123C01 TaxID=3457577 RepID=UPI00403ECCCF